ncbi:MAG: hypothetical protein HQL85_13555 [Magnetococcales bacterium]|nr:hypothetical protein [Magnetococcales bacterium]MBF0631993.1 hypothetical protein [Magnetococcales bacterium]
MKEENNNVFSFNSLSLRQEGPFLLVALMVAVLFFYAFSMAWPIRTGRDYGAYLEHYFGLKIAYTMFRPVGASYILGWISEWPVVWIEAFFMLLYLAHLLTSYLTARYFGLMTARVVLVLLMMDLTVLAIFHRLDGYSLFCLAISTLSAAMVWLHRKENHYVLFFLGLMIVLPILMRQTGIVLFLYFLIPVVCFGINRFQIMRSMVMALGVMTGLMGIMTYNYVHFDRWSISLSSGGNYIPTFIVYRMGPKFAEEYGPANRKLLQTIKEELLVKDVYVENKVDINHFIQYSLDEYKFFDLFYLDKIHPGLVRDAAIESIKARPVKFIKALVTSVWRMFVFDGLDPVILPDRVAHLALKLPREPELPFSYSMTPEVISQIELPFHPAKIEDKPILEKSHKLQMKIRGHGIYRVQVVFKYFVASILPPMLFFLALTFLLLFFIRSREVRLLGVLFAAALLIPLLSAVLNFLPEYRAPVDFLILLAAVVGVRNVLAPAVHCNRSIKESALHPASHEGSLIPHST